MVTTCLEAGLELRAVRRVGPDRGGEHPRRPSRWWPRRGGTARTSRARSRACAGVEDGVGSDEEGEIYPLEEAVAFLEATGVDCFAPAIGTAHGVYTTEPVLNPQRVTDLVARKPVPMVLHGGTGLSEAAFQDLIARGCAKVNISTALKVTYLDSTRAFLDANPDEVRPAVALPRAARGRQGDGRAAPHACSAARARPGDGADLRLRRRARGHRAPRPPARLQPDLRRVRPAGALVRGGVRREAEDRRRQGAHGQPAHPRAGARGRAAGRRRGPARADRRLARPQDGDLHRDGRGGRAAGAARGARG